MTYLKEYPHHSEEIALVPGGEEIFWRSPPRTWRSPFAQI